MRTKTEPGTFPTHLPGADPWSPRQRPAPEGAPATPRHPTLPRNPVRPAADLAVAGLPGGPRRAWVVILARGGGGRGRGGGGLGGGGLVRGVARPESEHQGCADFMIAEYSRHMRPRIFRDHGNGGGGRGGGRSGGGR